ncbi:MAG: hypothetical protein U0V73_01440 [Acidimicrobiia bacterium]
MSAGIGIVESAYLLARYQWVEERLFEILGGWAVREPDPHVKLVLGPDAARHAEHAAVWARLRPDVREAGPSGPEAPGPGTEALFAAVWALDAPAQTIERLVAVYRVVLPAMVARYEAHRARVTALADGPVIGALERVTAEERARVEVAEALLQSASAAVDATERALRLQEIMADLLETSDGLTR